MNQIPEMRDLLAWLGRYPRSSRQLNRLDTADCELLKITATQALALTIDTLGDEIDCGLYRDPFTMGWMTATASLSDLSAVGAEALGILISTNWGPGTDSAFKRKFSAGLKAALKEARVHLLGGDSGSSAAAVFSSVGVGWIGGRVVNRTGIRVGDILCHVGELGMGPALGYQVLFGARRVEIREDEYRPMARLREGRILRLGGARAMIDTSDGFISTLFVLEQLNNIGFELMWEDKLFSRRAVEFCKDRGLPLTTLLFAEHGDYQLLAVVPEEKLRGLRKKIPDLIPVGRAVRSTQGTSLVLHGGEKKRLPVREFQEMPRKTLHEIREATEFLIAEFNQACLL